MSDKLKLEILFGAIDRITKPLKAIQSGSNDAAKALKATKDQLRELNAIQSKIDTFKKVNKDLSITGNMLKASQEKIRALKDEIAKVPAPTRDMARAMKQATAEASGLKRKHNELREQQQRLRTTLNGVGMDTHKLADHQLELKKRIEAATGAVSRQSQVLEAQNQKMRRIHVARAEYEKGLGTRNKLAGTGATTMAAGVGMGLPILKAIRDFASFEDAMLGVARQVDGAKDANGRYTQTYYEMGDAIKALSERLPLTSIEFANIVEAAARMGVQGKDNLLIFAETAAKSAIAFDMPVAELSDQMGKLAGLYKIPIKDIASLGDAINYLDDNAQSKGGDIINVMQRIAGVTASVRMSYKEAAALGSTFLSLGSTAETSATASNAMIMRLNNAPILATAKRYREGLEMLGLDAHKLQTGMGKDATGTIQMVMDAINKLPQNKQLEAATRIFGIEYGDEAAKLANNLDEYRRQLKIVNEEKAKGSMDREAITRTQALSAQYELAKSSVFNLSSELGQNFKPQLVSILKAIADVLQGTRDWAKENPGTASAIMKTTAVIAAFLAVTGALMIGLAAVLGPLLVVRLGFAMLGIQGGGVLSMLMSVGKGFLWLGRIMLMNPIGLAITAIALAAFLIYRYWEPIKGFFGGLWTEIRSAFSGGILGIGALILNWSPLGLFYKAFAAVMSWFGIEMPGKFTEFGSAMMRGLVKGILGALGWVKDAVLSVAGSTVGWFKEKLGIHSPSRVFAELGGYTMEGLEQGLLGGQDGPLSAVMATAKRLSAIGAGVMLGGAAMAGDIAIDSRAPINSGVPMASASVPMQVTINIYGAPGQDVSAIRREVEQALANAESTRAARSRSRLTDKD